MTDRFEYDLAAAIAKWPNVPACYGWLSLDRRGNWRLQGEPVAHPGLRKLLDANYVCGDDGTWFVQNGPQKVFVTLDYMPLVLHFDAAGDLYAHTGRPAGDPVSGWMDDEGSVVLDTPAGPGLLDGRDLASFIEACSDEHGQSVDEPALLAALDGRARLRWRGLDLGRIVRADAPARFGFIQDPKPR
jgi:hypothetical protein